MTTSYQITPDLFLSSVDVPRDSSAAVPTPQPTNHIVVIDCSGSMYHDLPQIREQLKGKLPKLIAESDTLSIIWFSGRNEFGTLLKGEPLATLKDLADVNKAIDRWLRPVGLTGFKQPIEEAAKIADELGGVCNLFFMSDGYDNQWGKKEILQVTQALADKCAAATFVEYGYYCNHPLMVDMAETAGASLILSEDFARYEPSFEAAMQNRPTGGKKIEIDLKADAIRGFAFSLYGNSLLTFKVEGSKVQVPEYVEHVYFVSPSAVGGVLELEDPDTVLGDHILAGVYAAIALYAQRVESDIVLPLLKFTGDVRLIKQFSGCFGKQKYAEFVEASTKAAFEPDLRLTEGHDPSAIPDDNAFTVFDLLHILNEDEGNYLLVDSKDFSYKKIGRSRDQVVELPEDVQKQVEALDAEKDAKKIEKLVAPYQPLKFKADPVPNGVPINTLVFNEARPNISVQIRREGKVDLKARKNGQFKKVPDQIDSFIYRNYAVIRDGIINIDKLPLRLTKKTVQDLFDSGLPEDAIVGFEGEDRDKALTRVKKAGKDREVNLTIDLRALPVINRAMVKKTSAETLFRKEYELTKARSAQKVFNSILKDLDDSGRTSVGYATLYGEDAAAWLKEQGLTDYNGFNPGGKQSEAQDVYVGKELNVSLKGLSSIPALSAFTKRAEEIRSDKTGKKTFTASMELMRPAVEAVESFKASEAFKKAKDQDTLLKTWLHTEAKASKNEVRKLLHEVSQIRFSVIVGQTWFTEFNSLDENTLTLKIDKDTTIQGTVEMKEVEVPV